MKYNPNSSFEKSPNECPRICDECDFFAHGISERHEGTCTANGARRLTYDFSRPTDRPLPMPLNCYWWYMNSVWDKVSAAKAEGYREERRHEFVAWEMLKTLEGKERHAFVDHHNRPGGGGLIDFAQYPQAKPIYEEIKERENGRLS